MAAKKENHPVYDQGVAAAAAGLGAETCPYESDLASIWLDGFAGGDKKNSTREAEA